MGIGENTGCNTGENTGSSGKLRKENPVPDGVLYFDDFSSGNIYNPSVNAIGAYGQSAFPFEGNEEVVTWQGVSALKIPWEVNANPEFPGTYNSGKYEVFWQTPLPDIWISFDVWFDSNFAMNGGHHKMLALWEDNYGSGDNTDGALQKCYAVQEMNYETSNQSAASIQAVQQDVYRASRFPWLLNPATQKSCTTSVPAGWSVPSSYCPGATYPYAKILDGAGDLGRWVNFVYHAVPKFSSSDQTGLFELWKDGTLIMSTDHNHYCPGSVALGYRRMYLMGNASRGFLNQTNKYITNFTISGENIV